MARLIAPIGTSARDQDTMATPRLVAAFAGVADQRQAQAARTVAARVRLPPGRRR